VKAAGQPNEGLKESNETKCNINSVIQRQWILHDNLCGE